ncbi:MAG: 4Fe-4S dicluster domain-containing protein [bacterium]
MSSTQTMTRSEFLRSGLKSLFAFAGEAFDHQVESRARKMVIPLHRPPGAIDELAFLTRCTRCDLCAQACPHDAIVKAGTRYGTAVDTPMIRPSETPCYLCDDTPCIPACPEGALVPVDKINMGTAHVIHIQCFAFNGQVNLCDYCFDRCPLKGHAIVMSDGKPRVLEENCVGCGLCEYYCPAPGNAIKVFPDRV